MARLSIYHYRRLAELSPDFDRCPDDCPHGDVCEVKEQEADFRELCIETVTERAPGALRRFSLDVLLRDLAVAWNASAAAGEHGTEPHWTVRTARLVSIIRHEQATARRIDNWQRQQEIER